MKIMLVASFGGHFVQLGKIHEGLLCNEKMERLASEYVVVSTEKDCPLSGFHNYHHVTDFNINSLWKMFSTSWSSLKIIMKERPSVIISTGALPGLVICSIGRIFGSKTIWVDSIANHQDLSLSGKLARHVCNICLTQWPHVSSLYPKVDYLGEVL